jgi:hypothetical protein
MGPAPVSVNAATAALAAAWGKLFLFFILFYPFFFQLACPKAEKLRK